MAKARVALEGMEELTRKLRGMENATSGAVLLGAVVAGGEIVKRGASRRAPRRTGKLATNIEQQVVEAKKDKAATHIGPSREAWYGAIVEIGTSHSAAQPFMRPTMDEDKARIVREVNKALRIGVLKVARGR